MLRSDRDAGRNEAGKTAREDAVTDFNASALDSDPQGMGMLRAVIGPAKRQPSGEADFRAAEAAAENRSVRRRGHARREARASL